MMLSLAALLLAQATAVPQPMAMDRPVAFGDLETVCTGIGESKDDPQWAGYPIRIEFSNAAAQYLIGAHVVLSRNGKDVADLNCLGPWVLVKGPVGAYRVTATIDGSDAKPASALFNLGTGKQKRIVLRFPDFQANE